MKNSIALGHIVPSKGMEVKKAKVKSIFKISIPKMAKDIRSFLKHANLYRKFVEDFSNIVRHFSHLLVQYVQFDWKPACQTALNIFKEMLTLVFIMQLLDWLLPHSRSCVAQVIM